MTKVGKYCKRVSERVAAVPAKLCLFFQLVGVALQMIYMIFLIFGSFNTLHILCLRKYSAVVNNKTNKIKLFRRLQGLFHIWLLIGLEFKSYSFLF